MNILNTAELYVMNILSFNTHTKGTCPVLKGNEEKERGMIHRPKILAAAHNPDRHGRGEGHITPGAPWKGSLKPSKKASPPPQVLHSTEGSQEGDTRTQRASRDVRGRGRGGRQGKDHKETLWVPLADKYLPSPVRDSRVSSSPPQPIQTNPNKERSHPFPSVILRVAF